MKKIKYFIASLSFIMMLPSCSEDFLNKTPLDQYLAGNVWADAGLIQLYMNDMYRRIGHGYNICPLSSFVDEAVFTPNWGAEDFNKCIISPDNLYYWTGDPVVNLMQWSELYKSVRNVNIFFENYDPSVVSYEVQRNRFIGEAYFFRAYNYHWLTFLYGGVPIIDRVYTLNDNYDVARNTFEECVDYIVASCDSAINYLPENYDEDVANKGRATKGAAMALKARTLLYAASELYNNTSWATGYSNPELIGFQGGNRTARWQAAKDASKAIIDAGWYSLYKPNPGSTDSVALNFIDLFTSMSSTEDIFLRYFTLTNQGYTWNEYNPGKFWGPNGYHNWGNNTPTLQLVDAYEMKDGTKFDWNNPVQAAAPFSNRDPRFYATVLYHGAKWRQRTADVLPSDPVGLIDTKIFEAYKRDTVPPISDTMVVQYGIDTRKSPYEDWNGTYTGFYVREIYC